MSRLLLSLLTLNVLQPAASQPYERLRQLMVHDQLEARGISHRLTLDAMRKVPRHLFVPVQHRELAYEDRPLSIGYEQTISQPFMVASMTELLRPKSGDRILEIGAGSGYQAAVLAEIVEEVYTIEIVPELGEQTGRLLKNLGYENVHLIIGDGYKGMEEKAPFDAIIVTAAAEDIPPPLIQQLKEGGRMVIPIGDPSAIQTLMLVEKQKGKIRKTSLSPVRFVPFTREKGP